MWREEIEPRRGWRTKVEALGLVFAMTDLPDGTQRLYWNESARYELSMAEVERLETATEALHAMCVEAARSLASGAYGDLGLPDGALALAAESLRADPPSVYGRFDLALGVDGRITMLEYNADTPTGLVESAVVQWDWLRSQGDFDQWNSLWDRLVRQWRRLTPRLPSPMVHFAVADGEDSGEEWMTVETMRETAKAAGLDTKVVLINTIHYDKPSKTFVDPDDLIIEACFALYPWENMLWETYGGVIMRDPDLVVWIEPLWKVLLSNKMLAVALWDLFGDDPDKAQYLVPAYADEERAQVELVNWVRKPLHGREGENIAIHAPDFGVELARPGRYGEEGHIWQQYVELPVFVDRAGDRHHAVLGSWVVDGVAAGVGIRESDGPITDYFARFVPHLINDALNPAPEQVSSWLDD